MASKESLTDKFTASLSLIHGAGRDRRSIDGGPQCRLSILRNGNVPRHYFLFFNVDFKKVQCRLSILRNGNFPCQYSKKIPVDFKIVQCRLSNLRKGCVSLSSKGQGPFNRVSLIVPALAARWNNQVDIQVSMQLNRLVWPHKPVMTGSCWWLGWMGERGRRRSINKALSISYSP